MLFLNVLKLNALFSFEFLVLILAIFLLAYVSKNKLNKWYRYLSICCVVVLTGIIICTAVNAYCVGSGWHEKRGCIIKKSCHKGHGDMEGFHKGEEGKKRICPGKKAEGQEEATEAVEE